MKIKFKKSVIGYILFGMVVLFVMMYIRFPGDAVGRYIMGRFAEANQDLILTVGKVGMGFPPGLRLENVAIIHRDGGEAGLKADVFKVRPSLPNLLRGRLVWLWHADLYSGRISGEAAFQNLATSKGYLNLECNADGIQVERWGDLKNSLQRAITGKLRASIVYKGEWGALSNGSGNLDLTLLNGTYPLGESFFGFDRLDFSRTEGQMSLKSGVLKINRLRLIADKVQCSLKGDVYLNSLNLKQSRIDLNCEMELPGQGGKRIILGLSGTLGSPVMKFL
ncbi:MAG: type II secretion system protein GspN [Syntrophales bacterium]|jgi:type II secretion system protein N